MGAFSDLRDEIDEWEADPPTQNQSVFRFSLVLILIAAIIFMAGRNGSEIGGGPDAYEVLSVAHGAVQVRHTTSGERTELRDPQLVKQALSGAIKRGDVINQ